MAETRSRIEKELVGTLVSAMHLLQDAYAETARPLGLTPQQAHLLCVLLAGPLGMTELSRLLNIERSSLTSMVDRLERRNLVNRVPHPTDRRAYRIELTTPGRDLAHAAHNAYTERIETYTTPLTTTAMKDLTIHLTTILNTAHSH